MAFPISTTPYAISSIPAARFILAAISWRTTDWKRFAIRHLAKSVIRVVESTPARNIRPASCKVPMVTRTVVHRNHMPGFSVLRKKPRAQQNPAPTESQWTGPGKCPERKGGQGENARSWGKAAKSDTVFSKPRIRCHSGAFRPSKNRQAR